jgi:tRNA A-37 threonylcarbamoyl transferase component Bud32
LPWQLLAAVHFLHDNDIVHDDPTGERFISSGNGSAGREDR